MVGPTGMCGLANGDWLLWGYCDWCLILSIVSLNHQELTNGDVSRIITNGVCSLLSQASINNMYRFGLNTNLICGVKIMKFVYKWKVFVCISYGIVFWSSLWWYKLEYNFIRWLMCEGDFGHVLKIINTFMWFNFIVSLTSRQDIFKRAC